MMNFETIRNSVISLLGAAGAGQFQTIGFQRQSSGAVEIETLPFVQVYYKSGEFPKSSGSLRGPVQHDITFQIELLVSKPARVNLSVINNPAATVAAKQAAIAALQEASYEADRAMDELIRVVYQALMAADNIDLGLPVGTVANRWVDSPEKDNPVEKGELVVLSASMRLLCRTQEEVTGVEGVTPDPAVYSVNQININEDPTQVTEVEIQKGV